MAISKTLTNSSGSVAAPATLNVTKPSGGTPGATDILILTIGGGASAIIGSYTAPAGWTSIGTTNTNNGGNRTYVQTWWALGNVALLGFTKSGTVTDCGWVMVNFAGVDTSTPIDATATPNSSTAATTLVTNAVTIVTSQAWHLIGVSDWLGGAYSASGFTVAASPSTNEQAGTLYNTTPKSVGSTGTVTVTAGAVSTGQSILGVPFALRPASVQDTPELYGRPYGERGQSLMQQLLSY